MMKSISKIIVLMTVVLLIGTTSCNLDINVDPNRPATVPSGQLLSSAQVAIFTSFGHNGSGLGQVASIWVHQVMQRSNADGYASTGQDANISNAWVNLYSGALQDIENIITQSTKNEEFRYVGIAKLLKAYTYSMMVDVWGDIPYTEAIKGAANPFPKFDDDAAIYASLFSLIDEGLADIAKPQGALAVSPGSDDLIYGGSVNNWKRFGKALKLKMYNTIKQVQNVSTEMAALVADTDVSGSNFPDFSMKYGTSNAPENRNPAWITVSGATTYFSRYFYEILNNRSTLNPILSGIVDPRLPYYLYNSLGTSNTTAQNPTEYRDQPYATILVGGVAVPPDQRFFVGINFSSQSPNQGFDQSRSLSMPGVYFCGGRFDPAQVGGGVIIGSAPGNAPTRLMDQFMVSYIIAEVNLFLAPANSNPANARDALSTAIDQSFAEVNSTVTAVYPTATTISNAARDSYRNAVLAKYDAATSDAQRLELILTQKWIANFGNPLESYTDYRRTGFPVMFDPATDGDPNTNISRNYPFSFPYRQLDTNQQNPNAPAQKLIGDPTARIFWDKN
jgi:hypothetical protein